MLGGAGRHVVSSQAATRQSSPTRMRRAPYVIVKRVPSHGRESRPKSRPSEKASSTPGARRAIATSAEEMPLDVGNVAVQPVSTDPVCCAWEKTIGQRLRVLVSERCATLPCGPHESSGRQVALGRELVGSVDTESGASPDGRLAAADALGVEEGALPVESDGAETMPPHADEAIADAHARSRSFMRRTYARRTDFAATRPGFCADVLRIAAPGLLAARTSRPRQDALRRVGYEAGVDDSVRAVELLGPHRLSGERLEARVRAGLGAREGPDLVRDHA